MNIVGGSAANSNDKLVALGGYLLAAWMVVRAMIVGAVAVGLFLGALYFLYYLVRLSRLDHSSREFRQQQHHLETEKLLRYVILIFCLLLLNVLFYSFFEFGRQSIHTGIGMWLTYGGYWLASTYLRKEQVKKVS